MFHPGGAGYCNIYCVYIIIYRKRNTKQIL